jgi:hypothetical protein
MKKRKNWKVAVSVIAVALIGVGVTAGISKGFTSWDIKGNFTKEVENKPVVYETQAQLIDSMKNILIKDNDVLSKAEGIKIIDIDYSNGSEMFETYILNAHYICNFGSTEFTYGLESVIQDNLTKISLYTDPIHGELSVLKDDIYYYLGDEEISGSDAVAFHTSNDFRNYKMAWDLMVGGKIYVVGNNFKAVNGNSSFYCSFNSYLIGDFKQTCSKTSYETAVASDKNFEVLKPYLNLTE